MPRFLPSWSLLALAGALSIHPSLFAGLVKQHSAATASTPAASPPPAVSRQLGQLRWLPPPGMPFFKVPITGGPTDSLYSGQVVMFSKTLTTVAQYREFILAEDQSRPWPKPDFPQAADHPAVNVSWQDATAYCAWLTDRERREGRLPPGAEYRLPTSHEWSCAVSPGLSDDPGSNPRASNGRAPLYPWGSTWPPPSRVGNYAPSISDDGYDNTSPVTAFPPNALGLYDMGGNVWEWCVDTKPPGAPPSAQHILRGACWDSGGEKWVRSFAEAAADPTKRNPLNGFRCILVLPKSSRN